MAPVKFGVGQSVLRKEDDALIRGKGRYTDDYTPAETMHALVLRSPHPSPLSAHNGFFGTKPFSKANAFLEKHGRKPIDWQLPGTPE